MNRNIPVQVAYDRTNKGVDIRNPSTANFLIDSEDRTNFNASTVISTLGSTTASSDFTISKPGQNLITGFFTRLAMTEISLYWSLGNVSAATSNNSASFNVLTVSTGLITPFFVSIPGGNYTVQRALDALVLAMNTASAGTASTIFSITDAPFAGKKAITAKTGYRFVFFRATPTPPSPAPLFTTLPQQLGLPTFDVAPPAPVAPDTIGLYQVSLTASDPFLLPYAYIDITSPQLASQQKVKDATTSNFDAIDVIYRWVFVNDEAYPVSYDSYGYAILPGYLPFAIKRTIPFPKQVRWDPLIPIGNLQFQVYTDKEEILTYQTPIESFEFKMLMLISEV
jgi:hypothetical protein